MANLTQLKVLEGLNGFLLVDKPEGIAFSTVVKAVKRNFGLVKVGHGGSLDAQASGLMVLLLNDANKFVDRVMCADREYTGTLKFGGTTNTGDKYGAPMTGAGVDIAELRGDVFQVEPQFAAIRREGAAEYEVVDTGEHQQFMGHVYKFTLDGEKFNLRATKQVIPRALAIAMNATLMSLRRMRIGKFDVKDAIPFGKLLETEAKDFASCVMPLSKALL